MAAENHDIVSRTGEFALRILKLYQALPRTVEAQIIGKQLLRSGTSVGAHVREGKHSRSRSEMLSKVDVALQELEETCYWLDLLGNSGIIKRVRLESLNQEASELKAILFTSVKTLKGGRHRS